MQLMQNKDVADFFRPFVLEAWRCSNRSSKLTSNPFPWYYQKLATRAESLCLSSIRWTTKRSRRVSKSA